MLRRLLSESQGGDGYHKSVAGQPGLLTNGKRVKLLSQMSPLKSDPLKGITHAAPAGQGWISRRCGQIVPRTTSIIACEAAFPSQQKEEG